MNLTDFEELFKQGQFTFVNKTKTYLTVVMSEHGKDYVSKIRQLNTTGVFVDDVLSNIENTDYCLFFLFNVHRSLERGLTDFNSLLDEFRALNFYVADYPFGELFGGKLHTVVFKIPEKYYNAYDIFAQFKKGKDAPVYYSRMFTKEDIDRLFVALYGENTKAVKVLLKDPVYKEKFEEEINRYGIYAPQYQNVEWIILDPNIHEYEYKPNPEHEILNYRKP